MTKIWAHRGASAAAPENTLPAFELAIEQGADGFELDVQRSADGVLVVCHDESVDRTSNGTGLIAELGFEQLRALDFSNDQPGFAEVAIPTLAETLDLVRGTDLVVNIELKNSVLRYAGMEAEIDALVNELGLVDQVWYSSFNHLSLVELAELGSRVPRGALYVEHLVRPWEYVTGFGATALHPMASTVDAELVAAAHQAGVRLHVWTVDEPTAIVELADAGVDAVITNVPLIARQVLSE